MSDFMEKLEELRKKDPGALTDADRDFLAARSSYLRPDELELFGIAQATPTKDPAPKPSKGLTVAQLQEALIAKGIEFEPDAKRAHLAGLLDGLADEDETDEE